MRQVLNNNKDIISERTKYADARMYGIGAIISIQSEKLQIRRYTSTT